MPRQRIPAAWRRELTAQETIATAMADRFGMGTGVAAAAHTAASSAAAITERHRLPGVWRDPLGSVKAVLHQEPFKEEVEDGASPLGPGENPTSDHLVNNYRDYIGVQTWESMKQGLERRGVPMVTRGLAVRAESSGCTLSSSRGSPPLSDFDHHDRGSQPTPTTGSAGSSATRAVGRLCVGLSPRPSPSAPLARPHQTPRSRSSAPSFDAQVLRGSPPPLPSARAAVGAIAVVPAGAVGVEFGEAAATSREAAVAESGEHPPGGDAVGGGAREQLEQLRVQQVLPNALALNVADLRSPPQASGGGAARVRDRDRMNYPSSRQMRPAREQNTTSKKRLNELLEFPSDRLDATGQHPSRSFGVVPSQNLRVA